MIVADASAIASFVVPDEAGPSSNFALTTCASEGLHVPAHWAVELANVVWKAQRRKRITTDEASRAARDMTALVRTATSYPLPPVGRLVPFAASLDLTAYDAAFLWLAEMLGLALLTADGKLRRIAGSRGVDGLLP